MKVCLLGAEGEFTDRTGHGVLTYMYYLSEELHRMSSEEFQVVTKEFRRFPLLKNIYTVGIRSLFEDFSEYDIVHLLDTRPTTYIKYDKAISITTTHGFRPITTKEIDWEAYKTLHGLMDLYLARLPTIKAALKSDYLIANSTLVRSEAIELGFDKAKVFVTNLGVDKRYSKVISPKQEQSTFKVGNLSGDVRTKNALFAVKAFRNLKDEDMTFEIWGSKSGQYYEDLVEASRGDKRIKFMGFVPEDKKIAVYDSFDIFLYPPLYESFGLPILEAQARGLPVIIWKYGKVPEEVARYCLKAEDEDHMAEIIKNIKENGYNEKKRKIAMEYARSFTWKKTAEKTINVYRIAYNNNLRK